mmetsp:Transcript_8374/g.8539  ORF Transcript_8374/g.8539 Transcript_8374/m.8539 type:complete len:353 (-) Transcript_8374:191-1249(-)
MSGILGLCLLLVVSSSLVIDCFTLISSRLSSKKKFSLKDFSSTTTDFCDYLSILRKSGEVRPLLRNEYELGFKLSPELQNLASNKKWPNRKLLDWERKYLINELDSNRKKLIESDVNLASIKFRKTILGLEKYRINNPQPMSQKYCDFLLVCLTVDDCWGVAANAIEYAGLKFRDHVFHHDKLWTLNLITFWDKALDRLLDIPIDTMSIDTHSISASNHNTDTINKTDTSSTSTSTWDQKYFIQQQVSFSDGGVQTLQDMMMYLTRLACRAVLSSTEKDGVIALSLPVISRTVDMNSSVSPSHTLYWPIEDTVKIVLGLEFNILDISEYHHTNITIRDNQSVRLRTITLSNR